MEVLYIYKRGFDEEMNIQQLLRERHIDHMSIYENGQKVLFIWRDMPTIIHTSWGEDISKVKKIKVYSIVTDAFGEDEKEKKRKIELEDKLWEMFEQEIMLGVSYREQRKGVYAQ